MLDTDTVSFAIRGHGNVGERILASKPSALCISSLTIAELRFGADKRSSTKLHGLIDTFAQNVDVLPFDGHAAKHYGQLASKLAKRGTPIGEFNTLIAAHALSLGVTLVSNNTKHFTRIRGLKVDNWV